MLLARRHSVHKRGIKQRECEAKGERCEKPKSGCDGETKTREGKKKGQKKKENMQRPGRVKRRVNVWERRGRGGEA